MSPSEIYKRFKRQFGELGEKDRPWFLKSKKAKFIIWDEKIIAALFTDIRGVLHIYLIKENVQCKQNITS